MPDIEVLKHIDEVAQCRAFKESGGITYYDIVAAEYSDVAELLHKVREYEALVNKHRQALLQEYANSKTQPSNTIPISPIKAKILKYYFIALALICLVVPYQQTLYHQTGAKITRFHGYEFVFSSPKPLTTAYSPEISLQRLGLEFIAISAIAGIAYMSKCKK